MEFEDWIFILRYIFRFGFLIVASGFGVFIYFINYPALSKIFYKFASFFLIWFFIGLIVTIVDDALPDYERLFSLIFNIIMVYAFAFIIFRAALAYKQFEPVTEVPERPSERLFQILKTLPKQ